MNERLREEMEASTLELRLGVVEKAIRVNEELWRINQNSEYAANLGDLYLHQLRLNKEGPFYDMGEMRDYLKQ